MKIISFLNFEKKVLTRPPISRFAINIKQLVDPCLGMADKLRFPRRLEQ